MDICHSRNKRGSHSGEENLAKLGNTEPVKCVKPLIVNEYGIVRYKKEEGNKLKQRKNKKKNEDSSVSTKKHHSKSSRRSVSKK